jgi:hypothetical protein
MPVTLSQILSGIEERTDSMPFMGDVVEITWSPGRMTPELEARVAGLADVSDAEEWRLSEALADSIATLVVRWDLLESKGGPPISTDAERVKRLPVPFLWEVFGFLTGLSGPKAESEEPSPDSSPPVASSAKTPGGTGSSGRRGTSRSRRGTSRNGR